ncbi:hypothetical protein CLAFUW4_10612 [Fulvia fulva]|uniref:Uncharacterized protein n=1 Tax=Passalora fulva TaxID=5499 RepID=A0A9Q8LFA5_PASFU|nr:uncharacterized protein CLAFUR5_05225 [Fulvia fulva]KAK4615571.1 hypothetical protein CLAFUR4_10617 [Fulvia fulva]KAK4617334.1 hypothetical protein CLAFUR0_10627 [Fulvia fulva]UJO16339.1 hypothetical protein CLAFUR5_05225 [Fulvia fulva]WPV19428.1 hypothetical protein CLAFUW4_10612 [Fulvia fulva]WPV34536.1 hypothetical protein CLAFUW7_10614 [Fulvia fulva]
MLNAIANGAYDSATGVTELPVTINAGALGTCTPPDNEIAYAPIGVADHFVRRLIVECLLQAIKKLDGKKNRLLCLMEVLLSRAATNLHEKHPNVVYTHAM